ncbi:MAG: hypothetical protein ABIO45_10005 [Burkholderiaceae bacterium]
MPASSAKGSDLYHACLLAIANHKAKIRAKSGRTAVLYQGASRRGEIWAELAIRQQNFQKRMGFESPFELLTDCLKRESIPVRIGGKTVELRSLIAPGSEAREFESEEVTDLWHALSGLWVDNNDRLFLYVGAKKEPGIFKDLELPLMKLKKGKSAELLKQIEKAEKAIKRNDKVEKEMIEIDKCLNCDFKTFAKELLARRKAMSRIPFAKDELDALYEAANRLSKLSH